jgi:hypothetical protein
MQRFFDVAPLDFPARRELIIQNTKLNRLLAKRPSETSIGSGSVKKFNKLLGRHDAECGKQMNRVRSLFEKSRMEWMRRKGSIDGKPFTRRSFAAWNGDFKKTVVKTVQEVKKQLLEKHMMSLSTPHT